MYKLFNISLLFFVGLLLFAWSPKSASDTASYKCMVQLTNYQGEGAYMVISLIDPKGAYAETLYVMGEDEEWYPDMTKWWAFYEPNPTNIDGISGATISGGERMVCMLGIDKDKINAGYSLRFETAVEDQQYYVDDVEIPLTSESVTKKMEGKGYIRYVRMIPGK